MSEELDKIIGDKGNKPTQTSGDKKPEENKDGQVKTEAEKEAERLANIKKAIAEANDELRKARQAKKDLKSGKDPEDNEEELPKIDLNDPNSKAWDKHFSDKVNPLAAEAAKEKEEIRTYALQKFLADKPNLASDPEMMKRVIATYEKIKTASERTQEGVLIDLRRSYAAEFADELINDRQQDRVSRAQGDAIFSDIAVSRGGTSYKSEKETPIHISKDDEAILLKWGMTPTEWQKMKQAQDKKE